MLINTELLDAVSEKAMNCDRLRMNFNLHDSLDAKAQRLLNALQIGTVLPIHRHTQTAETYIVLRGVIKVFFYDDNKELTDTFILDPKQGNYGVHIPVSQWHTVEVMEDDTVIFEVKDGPYRPLKPEDIMDISANTQQP